MIEIETYIGRKDLVSYEENKEAVDTFFIPTTSGEALDVISSTLTKNKGRYLNGSIVIQVDQHKLTTFSDWDDLDLLWTGLVTMVLEYLQNGKYGATHLSNNALEWSIKKLPAKAKNLIQFHVKKPNAVLDKQTGTFVSTETQATLAEEEFLHEIISSADDFWTLRKKDSRTQNLVEFEEKYRELKYLIRKQ